jgi:hypothetical protein
VKKFDRDKLAEIDIYLGEPNEQVREGMRAMLRSEGLRRTRSFTRIEDLLNAMRERSPDLIDKLSQEFRIAIDSAAQRSLNEEDELAEKYEGRVAGNTVDI